MSSLCMRWVAVALVCFWGAAGAAERPPAAELSFDIPAQSLREALNDFGRQAGISIAFYDDAVSDLKTPGLTGRFTRDAALERLLANTRLNYRFVNPSTVAIQAAKPAPAGSQSSGMQGADETRTRRLAGLQTVATTPVQSTGEQTGGSTSEPESGSGTPEILVKGSRVLNMDIRRTRDDIQPYVVFDHEVLEASGAPNLDTFLKQRLTMNTVYLSNSQISDGPSSAGAGNMSVVNLRGLGVNQTLILIDGRRTASTMNSSGDGSAPYQADLNSIPVSAIERIEVLPTTASGTYGGSATGGVINVILRRDYTGAEVRLTQDESFRGDAPLQRADFSFGTNLEGGKTSVLLRGSYSDRGTLLHRDRDLTTHGRELVMEHNPAYFIEGFPPPLGSTTNIMSSDGSNLELKPEFGGTVLTSPITYIPVGYAGATPTNVQQLVANAGQYNLNLADSAQGEGGGNYALISGATVKSFAGTVRREFSSNIQAFIDLSASRNASRSPQNGLVTSGIFIDDTAPNNPFVQSLYVTAPNNDNGIQRVSSESRRAAAGVIVRLPRRWSAEADYTWNEGIFSISNLLSDYPDAGIEDGSLDVLRDTNLYPVDYSAYHGVADTADNKSRSIVTSVRLSGPLGSLPAGEPILSALLEHRRDAFGVSGRSFYTLYGTFVASEQSQAVDSAYAEINVPLVRKLEMQVAVRTDRYSTATRPTGIEEGEPEPEASRTHLSSSNPTMGLRFHPLEGLMLRASYSTGFQPPTVDQLVPPTEPFPFPGGFFVDPKRGNERSRTVLMLRGGNPDLKPEKSKSWSAGAVLTPQWIPGLRMSLDFTHIEKRDNIYTRFGTIPGFQLLVNNEDLLPGRVTRAPQPPTPDDPYGIGRITGLDVTYANLSRAKVDAFDAALDYHLEGSGWGGLDFYALATWQPHFKTQIISSSPEVDNAGIGNTNPLKLKANAGLTWTRNRWTAGWSMSYFGSYKVADPSSATSIDTILNQGSVEVPSQTYHDVFGKYQLGAVPAFFSTLQVQAGIRNVFDTKPPFDAGASTLGYYSPFGDPRLASYYLTITAGF